MQRLENLNDKNFLSLFKLIDLANFFDVPIYYLLGMEDDLRRDNVNTYRQVLQGIVNIFEKNLVEFDDKMSDTTRFFYIKIDNQIIVDFLIKYAIFNENVVNV